MRRRYGYYWAKLIGAVAAPGRLGGGLHLDRRQLVAARQRRRPRGVVMTQIAFLGHDAAHRQMFKSGRWNDWVSLIIANLLVGISYGWWQSKHTRHHAEPEQGGRRPRHRPDGRSR